MGAIEEYLELLMKLRLKSYGCHLPYGITSHLTQVNTTRLNPSQRPVLDLPTLEGWKAELAWVTVYVMFQSCPRCCGISSSSYRCRCTTLTSCDGSSCSVRGPSGPYSPSLFYSWWKDSQLSCILFACTGNNNTTEGIIVAITSSLLTANFNSLIFGRYTL